MNNEKDTKQKSGLPLTSIDLFDGVPVTAQSVTPEIREWLEFRSVRAKLEINGIKAKLENLENEAKEIEKVLNQTKPPNGGVHRARNRQHAR